MKKWYKQPYFNRRIWILENFDKLNLSTDEVVLLLIIDYATNNRITINYDYLMNKLNYDSNKVDSIIEKLVSKKYLSIKPTDEGVSFIIDGLFDFDTDKYELVDNKGVYEVAEDLLKRPLSNNELQKVSDLLGEYKADEIIDAIRVAEAYRKASIDYVASILRNEK